MNSLRLTKTIMDALTVTGATKTYPGAPQPIFKNIDLALPRGEAFVVLGATGSVNRPSYVRWRSLKN